MQLDTSKNIYFFYIEKFNVSFKYTLKKIEIIKILNEYNIQLYKMDNIEKQLNELDNTLNQAKQNNMMALAIVEENKRLERVLQQIENIVDEDYHKFNSNDNNTKIYRIRCILIDSSS